MTNDLAIRGGRIIDPASGTDSVGTILVKDGKITAVGGPDLPTGDARQVVNATGLLVIPGLIDIHVHCFEGETALGLAPDPIGVYQGSTTIVDAGSSGVGNLALFRDKVKNAPTRVLAFINISRVGLAGGRSELADPALLAPDETIAALKEQGDFLVGIKSRASASVVKEQGIAPIKVAKETAKRAGVPMMVHIGNAPPRLEEVLDLLEAGDIVTHALHGKKGGMYRDGKLLPEAVAALDRGVYFDVGHGQSSFAFATARRYLSEGRLPYVISTDLWKGNETGPVYSMLHTMTKLLHVGMPLKEVIAAATWHPAVALRREHEIGSLAVGRVADIALVKETEGHFQLTDSEGETINADLLLRPVLTVRAGMTVPPREVM